MHPVDPLETADLLDPMDPADLSDLSDRTDADGLFPLPPGVMDLLTRAGAPPRLVAHLRLVHDVSVRILDGLEARGADAGIDRRAVEFGAATHDIGKSRRLEELTGPGSDHEPTGRDLLLEFGVAPELARFAATHSSWNEPGITLDDLLVSLADNAWKNKRLTELEDLVVAALAARSGREAWEEFMVLDEILTEVGEGADARLAFQSLHPVRLPPGAAA